jgi:hypothetical protein
MNLVERWVRRARQPQALPVRASQRHRTRSQHPADRIHAWNKNPKLFVWTKTADEILDTLAAYYRRINAQDISNPRG